MLLQVGMADEELRIPLVSLNELICCPLCQGYLIDPLTVLECVHTFCKSCLLKHFDDNGNTCPLCDILIHQSHPTHYVKFDRAIQTIVFKLVPGLQEKEEQLRTQFALEHPSDDEDGEDHGGKSPKSGTQHAAGTGVASQNGKEKSEEEEGACSCVGDNNNILTSHHRVDEPIYIKLTTDFDEFKSVQWTSMRIPGITTINTIKRYLAAEIFKDKSKYNDIDILCNDELMGRDFSMIFIVKTRWRNNPDPVLTLSYRPHVDF